MLLQGILVQLDAQAGALRDAYIPVLDLEGIVGDLLAEPFQVHEVLGNEEVGYVGGHLQRRRQSHRGAVVVVG